MSVADYESALKLVHTRRDDTDFAGPQDESLIGAAESALGIAFPPIYRRFVRELGAGGIGSEEIYGVNSANFTQSAIPNGVWLTLKVRARSNLPPSMMIVYNAGEGEYFVLDTAQSDAKGECPVVVWEPGVDASEKMEVVAPDFGSFFLMIVQEGIASLDEED